MLRMILKIFIYMIYKIFKKLFRDLYYRKMTIDDAEHIQDEFDSMLNVLSNYTQRDKKILRQKISF